MRWAVVVSMTVIAILPGSLFGPVIRLASSELGKERFPPVRPERRSPALDPRFVRDAQRALHDLGYEPGPIDGILGMRTRAALVRYQQAKGLPTTGWLDTETMARLDIYERVLRTPRERQPDVYANPGGWRLASPTSP